MRNTFIILSVLVVISVTAFLVANAPESGPVEEVPTTEQTAHEPEVQERGERDCISDTSPVFTYDFTDPAQVRQVVPPVWGSRDHDLILSALLYTDGARVPVYMPADGALVDGVKYREQGEVFYYLEFRITCEVYFAFDHINEVTDEIAAVFPGPPQDDLRSLPFGEPKAHMQAGERIGSTTGAALAKNWNIAVYNRGVKNGVVPVPEGVYPDKYEAVACPFDYFTDDIAEAYRSKLVTSDRDISVKPNLCAS